MIVTDLNYALENKLIKRLDAFANMVCREKQIQDVLFTVHGRTGTGKTNTSLVIAYYLKWIIKEKYKQERDIYLFFNTEKAVDFAKLNRDAIIIIDEPSLDSLSRDQMTTVNKNFMRLLNTMRQKRLIVIVNITRFWRFPFDLVVDRALSMVNMYNKDGKKQGRFQYIRQKNLERLWDEYQRKKIKLYGKLKAFGGNMPERMEKLDDNGQPYFNRMGIIIDGKKNCTYEDYKYFREKAVNEIGVDKRELKKDKASKFEIAIGNASLKMQEELGLTQEEIGEEWFKISQQDISDAIKRAKKSKIL